MAEQTVELAPDESKVVTFEAIPREARTYQVSVNGLTGSFKALAPPWANITLSVVNANTKAHLSGIELRMTHENGSWAQNLHFSSPGFFSGEEYGFTAGYITITARKSGYQDYSRKWLLSKGENGITIQMVPIAPPFDPWSYDFNGNGVIDTNEMLAAANDYYAGIITKAQLDQVSALWEATKPPPPPECATKAEKVQAASDYFAGRITKEEAEAILSLPTCP